MQGCSLVGNSQGTGGAGRGAAECCFGCVEKTRLAMVVLLWVRWCSVRKTEELDPWDFGGTVKVLPVRFESSSARGFYVIMHRH